MRKTWKNNRGASLIEILAIIVLASIVFSTVNQALRQNIRQNALNQERLLNSAIANSAVNYVQTINYQELEDNLYEGDSLIRDDYMYFIKFQNETCNELFTTVNDQNFCKDAIGPTVNGKNFSDRIHIYVLPFDHTKNIKYFIDNYDQFNEIPILKRHLEEVHQELVEKKPAGEPANMNIVRVIVVVESTITDSNDYIIEGVVTNEN